MSEVITNYSQQDATFLEYIYFYRLSTSFRRFLRPSSGAHNCTYSFRYCQSILLLAAIVEDNNNILRKWNKEVIDCRYQRRYANNGNNTVEKAM
jgi:hypothetical protein